MAKITRQTFVQFGVNVNAAADICEFGTPATGSPVYTTTIATLQANAAWTTGWAAETVASNRPFLEDMNAYCYVVAYMLAYIFEMGIPEWDSGTTYYTNSIVQSGGILYQSLIDTNLNNAVGTTANWRQFTSPAPVVKCTNTQAQGTSGGGVTSGGWNTVILNTKDIDTASIATLSTNQIALPAGTYTIDAVIPLNKCDHYQSRLYNVTDSAVLINGDTGYAANGSGIFGFSHIKGQFTLAASKTISVQYQVGTSEPTDGQGAAATFGTEVFAIVLLTKIS